MKPKKYQIIIFLIFAGIFISIILFTAKESFEKSDKVLANFDLELSGIVAKKVKVDVESGYIYLDSVKSNYTSYGLDQDSKFFYCKQIKDEAIVTEFSLQKVEVGDKLAIHGKSNISRLYRSGNLIIQREIKVSDYKPFYDKINLWVEDRWKSN